MGSGKKDLTRRFNAAQHCAESGRFGRFLAAPWKYLSTMYFLRWTYPRTKKGKLVEAMPFFGLPMRLVLPAGADIYITGAKSHDSELRLARYMLQHLKSGQHFLDIGAHIGYFSLLASRLVGEKGRVVSIEAAKSTFDILKQNTEKQANITAFNYCLAEENGEQTLYEYPLLYNEYNTLYPQQFEQQAWAKENPPTPTTVQALSFTSLMHQTNLRPHLVKIDVEGAEDQVIAGAADWLAGLPLPSRPIFVVEYLAASRHNEAHQRAKTMLESLDYQPFIIDKKGDLQPCGDLEAHLSRHDTDSDNIVFLCSATHLIKKQKKQSKGS